VEDVVKLDEQRRATQVELDGILAESNKLSRHWRDDEKRRKSKAAILKEKSGGTETADALATELTEKLYTLQPSSRYVPVGKTPEKI
jgi:seryl-tRNA synthetase